MGAVTVDRAGAGSWSVALTAWAMIGGALLQVVLGFPLAAHQDPSSPVFGLIATLNAVSHLLLLAGMVGLARSGAAGRDRLAVGGLGLTLLGLAMLVVAEAVWLSGQGDPGALYGVATLALGLGPILAGVAVIRAGRWGGWRRFTLLACGLYVPLALLPSMALPGPAMNYAIGLWGVCWLLLGVALRSAATEAS